MGRKSVIKKRYVDLKLKEKYTVKLLVYFQKHGLNDFSMSKLASDFNISKTTLYNHFDSKESMIDAAVVYKLNSINDYKTVLFDKDLDYFERLRKAMLFYCVQIFEISRNLKKRLKKNILNLGIKWSFFNNKCYMNCRIIINWVSGLDITTMNLKLICL